MKDVQKAALSNFPMSGLKQRISSILRDTHEVEDAIQDAYVRVLEFDDLHGGIQNPAAYLYRVARNVAIDKIRRKRRTDRIFVALEGGDDVREQIMTKPCMSQRADEKLQQQQVLTAVMHAVAELPPKCGRAYLLSCVEEHTYSEIAAEIGVSVSMIEKYVAHARRHVRATVAPEYSLAS